MFLRSKKLIFLIFRIKSEKRPWVRQDLQVRCIDKKLVFFRYFFIFVLFLSLSYLLFQLLIVALSVSKHFLFVQYKTITKKVSGFRKFFLRISKFLQKSKTFVILSIHKTFRPWGHVRSHTKFVPDRFSRCDVYWIQTNKQTDRQTSKVYIKMK